MSTANERAASGPPASPRGAHPAEGPAAVWMRGVVGGVLGALAAAIWFLVIDTIAGRPLYTPAALGSALFHGVRDPALVEISIGRIAGYTILHFIAFAAIGTVASHLLSRVRRHPRVLLLGLLLTGVLVAFFIGLTAILAQFLLAELAWWAVAGGSAFAALVMVVFFTTSHPGADEAGTQDPFRNE